MIIVLAAVNGVVTKTTKNGIKAEIAVDDIGNQSC